MSTGPRKNTAKKRIQTYMASHLGAEVSIRELMTVGECARNTVSGAITALVSQGWIITKPSMASFVCHAIGSAKPTYPIAKRQYSLQAMHKVHGAFPTHPQVVPPAPEVAPPVVVTPVVQPEPVSLPLAAVYLTLMAGDLLEVVHISKGGRVYGIDNDGNLYTLRKVVDA